MAELSVRKAIHYVGRITIALALLFPIVLLYLDTGGMLLGSYFRWEFSTPVDVEQVLFPRDIVVALMFVYEPSVDSGGMRDLLKMFASLAAEHTDSDGRKFQLTFACPGRDTDSTTLYMLTDYCRRGLGEVEYLIPWDYSSEVSMRDELGQGLRFFNSRGWMSTVGSEIRFAVVGEGRGDERGGDDFRKQASVLSDLGCYADMSFPGARNSLQQSSVNTMFMVSSADYDPYNESDELRAGRLGKGGLLVVEGPFLIDWTDWRFTLRPYVEDGYLSPETPPDPGRVDSWVRANVHVIGQPNWIFVKLTIGGLSNAASAQSLGHSFDQSLMYLEEVYNDSEMYRLHYVTAREMYNVAMAAQALQNGDAGLFRDYLIEPYEAIQQEQVE
jgi:hypothetical protein